MSPPLSVRQVQRLIADLRGPGADPRHPRVKPAGLRLGWLEELSRPRPGAHRGGTLYGGNQYVLQLDPNQLALLEAQWRSARSDRSDMGYPQDDPSDGRFRRSDRSDMGSPSTGRSDMPKPLVLAGQTEATGEPVSLSHVLQGGRDTHPGWHDRAPLRSAASGSAARSAGEDQERARNGSGGPGPVDWRAVLGQTRPDDGERFASREEEEREKRRRAEQLLADPDPPCADCPPAAVG